MTRRRAHSATLSHPIYGHAVVRDQKPLGCQTGRLPDRHDPSGVASVAQPRVFFWLGQRLPTARAELTDRDPPTPGAISHPRAG
jgi:hypothetical protein